MGKIRKRPEVPDFIVREVKGVPLTFLNEAGEQVKEKFTIQFKSYTERGAARLLAELRAEGLVEGESNVVSYTAMNARRITAIIDGDGEALTDETGARAGLTQEFFTGMLPEDLKAIQDAVEGDSNPLKPWPSPGDSGSSPAESGA